MSIKLLLDGNEIDLNQAEDLFCYLMKDSCITSTQDISDYMTMIQSDDPSTVSRGVSALVHTINHPLDYDTDFSDRLRVVHEEAA